jgi:hypothetical protein
MLASRRHGARIRRAHTALLGTLVIGALVGALVYMGIPATAALFTGSYPKAAALSAAHIFRGERTTTGFSVSDVSSGTAADQSYSAAFGTDNRYFVSRPWSSTFSTTRYLELDLSAPLPAGLTVSNGTLALRFASDAGTGTVCVYVELRRASTGAVLSTHGSSASPLGCTSGSTYSTLSVALSAVTTTDIANDLRVRIYASDSASGALRLDRAVVVADTPYNTVTLYPTLTREQYSGRVELLKWGLGG